ncbi:hypothetical protein FA15DRAFT_634405 [Coprinopsis marcescibilis]|uniref:DUF6593 domain-containing protein n=1 Tax=Coprinopsis marcescibilis TaxID=230819 RepID=A0A5C3L551_COPMA|nr:hypothetical protein FA15DRAFT_634405 [Coprinopsis marcescibilis]
MHGTNPYAQAGWYNPQNPLSLNTFSTPTPSVFGALPYPSSQTTLPTVLSFHFVLLNPNVLNCMITGPTSIPFLEIVSNAQTTQFRKPDGRVLAAVEWSANPTVEISGALSRRYVSQWMPLSSDRSRRSLNINGQEYLWIATSNALCLFFAATPASGYLVRVQRGNGSITMELTAEAFQLGLLESAIVATVILQSGRNIP